jgi:hypothetical protein
MRFSVKMPEAELDALRTVIGTRLDQVAVDGWSAELRSGELILSVIPVEVATPDDDHPHGDVERPMVRLVGESAFDGSCSILAEGLGLIRAVNVISILVSFTPVVDCSGEEIIAEVRLPPGSTGYNKLYFPPEQGEQAEQEVGAGALIDLDVAFELECERCPSVVVYTSGFFVQVSLEGLPVREDWASFGTYVRRRVPCQPLGA